MRKVLLILALVFVVSICEAQRPHKTKRNRDLRKTMRSHKAPHTKERRSVHHVTTGEKIGFGLFVITLVLVTYNRD